jgi:hypothetical protein
VSGAQTASPRLSARSVCAGRPRIARARVTVTRRDGSMPRGSITRSLGYDSGPGSVACLHGRERLVCLATRSRSTRQGLRPMLLGPVPPCRASIRWDRARPSEPKDGDLSVHARVSVWGAGARWSAVATSAQAELIAFAVQEAHRPRGSPTGRRGDHPAAPDLAHRQSPAWARSCIEKLAGMRSGVRWRSAEQISLG